MVKADQPFTLYYNRALTNLAWLNIPDEHRLLLKTGPNAWATTEDVQMIRVVGDPPTLP